MPSSTHPTAGTSGSRSPRPATRCCSRYMIQALGCHAAPRRRSSSRSGGRRTPPGATSRVSVWGCTSADRSPSSTAGGCGPRAPAMGRAPRCVSRSPGTLACRRRTGPVVSAGRVLVVDDEPAVGRVVSDLLGDEGYEVRWATNGEEALRVLDVWLPDVIVLDLMMPVMDGPSFRVAQRHLP